MCDRAKCQEMEKRLGSLEDQVKFLKGEVGELKTSVSNIELDIKMIRHEMADGFSSSRECTAKLDTAIDNLAHDLGSRMNTMHRDIVEEQALEHKREAEESAKQNEFNRQEAERWGTIKRKTSVAVASTFIVIALAATGANYAPKILAIFN